MFYIFLHKVVASIFLNYMNKTVILNNFKTEPRNKALFHCIVGLGFYGIKRKVFLWWSVYTSMFLG